MIITFSFNIIIVVIIVIDLATPIDSLVLYNFSQNNKLKTKESFAYNF